MQPCRLMSHVVYTLRIGQYLRSGVVCFDLADVLMHLQEQVGGQLGIEHCWTCGGGLGGNIAGGGCTAGSCSWQDSVVAQEEVDLWICELRLGRLWTKSRSACIVGG